MIVIHCAEMAKSLEMRSETMAIMITNQNAKTIVKTLPRAGFALAEIAPLHLLVRKFA